MARDWSWMTPGQGQPGAGPGYPGYAQLLQQVLQGIQGVGQSQSQAIQDTYAQQSGQAQQQMISSGLGNSTVTQSVQRGLSLDEQKAQIALQNQLAQLSAGYTSQLGVQGLQQQGQYQQQQIGYGQQMQMLMQQLQAQKTPFGYGTFTPMQGNRPSNQARSYGYTNVGA